MGQRFLDQYSLLHFASGVIAYFFGINWVMWLVLHTLFEILENTAAGMRIINDWLVFWPGGKTTSDSVINSVGDTVAAMVGWYVAYQLDSSIKLSK